MRRLAKAGRPKTAVATSDTPAAKLNATTLRRNRRSAAPPRSSEAARSSIAAIMTGSRISSRANNVSPARPRRSTPSGAGLPAQLGIGPFVEHMAIGGQDAQRRRAGLDGDGVAGAGSAVEIDGETARRRCCRHAKPPTPSASARPSPSAELGPPLARTPSSAPAPESSADCAPSRHSAKLTTT